MILLDFQVDDILKQWRTYYILISFLSSMVPLVLYLEASGMAGNRGDYVSYANPLGAPPSSARPLSCSSLSPPLS